MRLPIHFVRLGTSAPLHTTFVWVPLTCSGTRLPHYTTFVGRTHRFCIVLPPSSTGCQCARVVDFASLLYSEHASGSRCDCRFMLCLVSPLVTQLRGPGAPLLIAFPHGFIILQLLASGFIFGQWSHATFVILLVGYSGHFDNFCNSRRNRLAGVFSIHASANPA